MTTCSFKLFSSQKPNKEIPYQTIEIRIVNVCVHVSEIATHRENYIIGTACIRLLLNVIEERFQLNFEEKIMKSVMNE